MQDSELDSYLGGTEVTDEQRASLHRASDMIDARYPHPDDQDARMEAFSGATMVILGDATIEELVAAFTAARQAMVTAQEAMTGALIVASETDTELGLSQRYGLARNTVRKALGK